MPRPYIYGTVQTENCCSAAETSSPYKPYPQAHSQPRSYWSRTPATATHKHTKTPSTHYPYSGLSLTMTQPHTWEYARTHDRTHVLQRDENTTIGARPYAARKAALPRQAQRPGATPTARCAVPPRYSGLLQKNWPELLRGRVGGSPLPAAARRACAACVGGPLSTGADCTALGNCAEDAHPGPESCLLESGVGAWGWGRGRHVDRHSHETWCNAGAEARVWRQAELPWRRQTDTSRLGGGWVEVEWKPRQHDLSCSAAALLGKQPADLNWRRGSKAARSRHALRQAPNRPVQLLCSYCVPSALWRR